MLTETLLSSITLADSFLGLSPKALAYAGFLLLVFAFLALDLGVFHRKAHEVSFKEALGWSVVWVACGLGFSAFVYFAYQHHWLGLGLNTPMYAATGDSGAIVRGTVEGATALQQYLTAYVVEKSLAMDNIFVIAMIFAYFLVPAKYQHRLLFWGILGALVMRGALIAVGSELILRYTWILIIFGLFLIGTAAKMALLKHTTDIAQNPIIRIIRRIYPVTTHYDGPKFFTVIDGVRHATPLLLALVMVEVADLIFAVDSIPAVFAITPDPFIVFTSNILAILGLRSLYFCLAAMIQKFRFLKPALVLILAFVGVKLLLLAAPPYIPTVAGWLGIALEPMKSIKLDTSLSLGVVLGVLALAVVASVLVPGTKRAALPAH